MAPLRLPPRHKHAQGRLAGVLPHEDLPFWLVRWLLFRLMFASGVVKLTSRCPAWWGITGEVSAWTWGSLGGVCPALTIRLSPAALTYHFETQCLPTPASWFAHHLPVWLHKLSVVATFLIEIAVPPLFFAPVRRLRLAAFYSQVGGVLSHQEDRQDMAFLCTAQRVPLGMGCLLPAVRKASQAEEQVSLTLKVCLLGRAAASLEDVHLGSAGAGGEGPHEACRAWVFSRWWWGAVEGVSQGGGQVEWENRPACGDEGGTGACRRDLGGAGRDGAEGPGSGLRRAQEGGGPCKR